MNNVKLNDIPEERHMTFDMFLTTINEWGRFQKTSFYILCFISMVPAFMFYTWIFIAAIPEFRCHLPLETDKYNAQQNEIFDQTYKPTKEDCAVHQSGISLKECQRCYLRVSSQNTTSISELQVCHNYVFDRSIYEKTLVEEWIMVCDRVLYRTVVQIAFFVGIMVGAIFFGSMADRYGRRPIMSISFIILIIVCFFSTFGPQSKFGIQQSHIIFVIGRFLVACSVRGIVESGFVLSTELVIARKRVMANAVMNYVYVFGMLVLVAFAYYIRTWRMLLLVTSLFMVPFCFFYWILPESPRWLLSKGRYDEAEKILKKIARINRRTFDQQAYNTFKRTLRTNYDIKTNQTGILNLFQSKIMRVITLNLFFQWFTQNLVYYGVAQSTGSWQFDPYVSFCVSAVVELFAYILFHVILDRVGRKLPYCMFAIAFGFVAMLIIPVQMFTTPEQPVQRILLFMINVFLRFCGAITYVIIYLLTSELLPTNTRTTGLGYCSTVGRLGAIMGTFCNDYLVRISSNLPILLYGFVSMIAAVLALLFPETLNRSLPQNIDEVDRMGLAFGIFRCKSTTFTYKQDDELDAEQLTENADNNTSICRTQIESCVPVDNK